jgi:non-ribosomal peptide synthetase component F
MSLHPKDTICRERIQNKSMEIAKIFFDSLNLPRRLSNRRQNSVMNVGIHTQDSTTQFLSPTPRPPLSRSLTSHFFIFISTSMEIANLCNQTAPITLFPNTNTMKLTIQEPDKVIPDYILDQCSKHPNKIFLTQPYPDGTVQNWTFAQFLSESKKMATHLTSLDLSTPSQIAIMSKNCAYWLMADLAIMLSGHVGVPIYPTLTADTTKYTLEHSEAKLLFVGKLDDHPWQEMKKGIPGGMKCISFPMCPDVSALEDCETWEKCVEGKEELKEVVKRRGEEMATIIYTSGSTGV